jgi:glutamine synthetase
MNPYLGAAAMIAAGLDGIDRRLDPGPPRNTNLYKFTPEELQKEGVALLPQSLSEALLELERDPLFSEQLGSPFIEEFIALKRMEWVEYHRHVSDWEVSQYLQFF